MSDMQSQFGSAGIKIFKGKPGILRVCGPGSYLFTI